MGRPVSDDPRDLTICVRVNAGEKREIEKFVADSPGGSNRSEILRRVVLDAARSDGD